MKRFFQASFIILVILGSAYSSDLLVPGDYPAIQLAIDAAVDGDTIIVDPGTYEENLLFLGKPITVRSAQGAEVTVIDGMKISSVVSFLESEQEDTLLEGFTLTNGNGYLIADKTYGGGVYCGPRCQPMLRSLIICDNQAWHGGAVFGVDATPTFDHCIMSNNNASIWGAGVYCSAEADMKLLYCTITENKAVHRGGGVLCLGSSPLIFNCIISYNECSRGAGIYSVSSNDEPVVVNTNVLFNHATGYASGFFCESNAIVINSIFWNYPTGGEDEIHVKSTVTLDLTYSVVMGGWPGVGNFDARPGFLFAYNHDYHLVAASPCVDAGNSEIPYLMEFDIEGDPRVFNGEVDIGADEFCTPHGSPGEYYVPDDYSSIQDAIDASYPGDVIIVRPGTYIDNLNFKGQPITVKSSAGASQTVIDGEGGIIDNKPVVRFEFFERTDSVLQGFTLTNGSGYTEPGESLGVGGGVHCKKANPTLLDNVIEQSRASSGGGIFISGGYGPAEINGCVLRANQATKGGGIYLSGSGLIENCTVEDNSAGGGIYTNSEGAVTIRNNVVRNNQKGAGIECKGYGQFLIENNTIHNNSREGAGGGICLSNYELTVIRDNSIIGNYAQQGGGIHSTCKNVYISNNIIACNVVDGHGGGIRLANGGVISKNIICYNVANLTSAGQYGIGGGVLVQQADEAQVINCLIYKNSAARYGGGLYIYQSADVILSQLTLFGNSAIDGNAIYASGQTFMTIGNSILRNEGTDEIYSESTSPVVAYSNVKGGWPGDANIDADPLFVDGSGNDFHLRYDSPCRNAGSADHVMGNVDFEGDPRSAYGYPDMGADEFFPHLYYTGNPTPGGNIDVKFIGIPNDTVRLWIGSGVLDPPLHHPVFGDWYLEAPILLDVLLGTIPSPDGVYVLPVSISPGYVPWDVPLQAGIGSLLSNLCLVEGS